MLSGIGRQADMHHVPSAASFHKDPGGVPDGLPRLPPYHAQRRASRLHALPHAQTPGARCGTDDGDGSPHSAAIIIERSGTDYDVSRTARFAPSEPASACAGVTGFPLLPIPVVRKERRAAEITAGCWSRGLAALW